METKERYTAQELMIEVGNFARKLRELSETDRIDGDFGFTIVASTGANSACETDIHLEGITGGTTIDAFLTAGYPLLKNEMIRKATLHSLARTLGKDTLIAEILGVNDKVAVVRGLPFPFGNTTQN